MMLTMSGQVSELTLRMMTRIDVIIISPPITCWHLVGWRVMMSQIVMIMVELTSESCSCLVNMSGRDHRVLYRFRIDDDGDEISHLSIW